MSAGVATEAVATACAERMRRAIARPGPAVERLSYGRTQVCLRLSGGHRGVTLRLDRDPVEVVDIPEQSEIEITLDAELLDQLAAGRLLLQRALMDGRAHHLGPVWKFLRVAPILMELLNDGESATPPPPGGTAGPAGRAAAEDMWAIDCRGVHKSFRGAPVLAGVDLRIPEGLVTIVLGPSGTGKSVLLKHTIGLLKPDRGELLVRGRSLARLSTADLLRLRRRIGVLFQDGALWASLSVGENVAFPLRQHTDLGEAEIDEIVSARLAEVGLRNARDLMPAQLSGGMRKRAGLARAVALEPEIVLFDEPDSGLDPVRTALLCDLIARIHADHGGTFVVVTHDIGVLRRIGHYVAVLWEGRIAAEGFSDEILASSDPFVSQFLAGDVAGPLGMD